MTKWLQIWQEVTPDRGACKLGGMWFATFEVKLGSYQLDLVDGMDPAGGWSIEIRGLRDPGNSWRRSPP
jgi:hypothetical protein